MVGGRHGSWLWEIWPRTINFWLATIHSVAESGGLSDERCFPPIGRSASQCCRPVNEDNLKASFCNRHLRFRSVTVRARKRACEWFAEFARRLNRHDQFATDICDIRTHDFIKLPCRCKTYALRDALNDIGRFFVLVFVLCSVDFFRYHSDY